MTRNLARLTLVLFVVALPAGAEAEVADLPPLPERNPFRQTAVLKPVLPGDQPTVAWTDAEVADAAAKCKELLTGDPLDYELLPPIKEGLCGAPAPVLLRAVGHDPKVTINPPATLSCPMADVLGEWLRDTVQPEARALFGSPVVKIQNSSSYICRNRYGGAGKPLSEHALANAFDVSEFILANGVRITVLDHWPRVVKTSPTPKQNPVRVGDEAASAPRAKPKGGDRRVITAAKAEPGEPPAHDPNPFDEDDEPPPDADPVHDPNPFDDHAAIAPPAKPEGDDRGAVDAAEPDEPQPVTADPARDSKSGFVTFLHEDACRRFGTVLGPNANEAHKDHFHLDMKKRRRASFCE